MSFDCETKSSGPLATRLVENMLTRYDENLVPGCAVDCRGTGGCEAVGRYGVSR